MTPTIPAIFALPPERFDYRVARELGMSVAQLRAEMPGGELLWWLEMLHREAADRR